MKSPFFASFGVSRFGPPARKRSRSHVDLAVDVGNAIIDHPQVITIIMGGKTQNMVSLCQFIIALPTLVRLPWLQKAT